MEAVGQLAGGIAHDFNNLLAVIGGNTELVADDVDPENDQIGAIFRAVKRGGELTNRLLAFSRQQRLTPRPLQLAELVAGVSELLKRTLGETIRVESDIEDGLWTASADPGQVENALLNLALNGREAMPEGGTLTLSCSNDRLDQAYAEANPEAAAGDYVLLAVSDTGTGMSAEVQTHAFEPFFTTKEVGEGTGLGLSISYGIVKDHQGEIEVVETGPEGTTIRIRLPVSKKESGRC